MEYKEPARAKRIRARERMMEKARRIAARHYPRPNDAHRYPTSGELLDKGRWTDLKGQPRIGRTTWDDVFELRDIWAHNSWNHLASCSCPMCGNPRRWFRVGTTQETLADIGSQEQFQEVGRIFRRRFRNG